MNKKSNFTTSNEEISKDKNIFERRVYGVAADGQIVNVVKEKIIK